MLKYCNCFFLLFSAQVAFADRLYIKLEKSFINKTPVLAIGYRVSDSFDFDVAYSAKRYSIKKYNIKRYRYKTTHISGGESSEGLFSEFFPKDKNTGAKSRYSVFIKTKSKICIDGFKSQSGLFSKCFKDNPVWCSKIVLLKRDQICGKTFETYSSKAHSISGLSSSGKLHSVTASAKYKPFKRLGILVPYISVGVGIGHSDFKYNSYYVSGSHSQFQSGRKRANKLALEVGIGSKVELHKRILVDINAKYFYHGKHPIAPNIYKRFAGYKMSAGLIIMLGKL